VNKFQSDLAAIVETPNATYPIWVGWDILNGLGERLSEIITPGKLFLVTDEYVHNHASDVASSLSNSGFDSKTFVMTSGESNKNLDTVLKIYEWLAINKAERGDMILAVGGGVVGDIAGYVAATFLRGIAFAQIPTTLLAIMDSSIGGKVGVDLPQGKNLVGAFYQPKFVLSDVKTLETLPERELNSGWAEAIKHGLILDKQLFESFETDSKRIKSLHPEIATQIIRKSVAIKANVVSKDEKETLGIRILLNYGHTIGHAIEASTNYMSYLHGEAVSIGMMAAAYISESIGLLDHQSVERQKVVLQNYGLPIDSTELNMDLILETMKSDKKTSRGTINWVVLDEIGEAKTNNQVDLKIVKEAINKISV
tara:strand:- start:22669 stop:23772 length:1104 start_codon:yes stop_codon:yes gene_type:complete